MSTGNAMKPHVTHELGCGCRRYSNGVYRSSGNGVCLYLHTEAEMRSDAQQVAYACGCLGYCRSTCGAEARLRDRRDAEGRGKKP